MFKYVIPGRNRKVAAVVDENSSMKLNLDLNEPIRHLNTWISWRANLRRSLFGVQRESVQKQPGDPYNNDVGINSNNPNMSRPTLMQSQSILDTIPSEICLVDHKTGKIIYANSTFQCNIMVLGLSRVNLIFDIVSGVDRERFQQNFTEYLDLNEGYNSGNYLTKVIINDDQEERVRSWTFSKALTENNVEYILLTSQPLSSETLYEELIKEIYETNSISMINSSYQSWTRKEGIRRGGLESWKSVKFTIDQKAKKRVELKEAQMKLSLMEETLETKRMFVRYVSHEVRTPLNVVVSGLQILSGILDAEHSEALGIVEDLRSACSTAVDILNDILTYEKLDSNILTIQKEDCNIVSIVEQVYAMFQLQARQSNIHLQFNNDLADSIVTVVGDSTKLAQVVRNLVSNAVKFTPDGGKITLSLRIQERERQGGGSRRVRLEVQDTGPGMRREERRKLFNEVIQFNPKELQNGQGSGLGLFLARKIVDMHDGSIGVDVDWSGPGSIFYLELPFTAIASVNQKRVSKVRRVSLIPEPTRMLKLLLVDDAVLVRKFHKRVLSPHCDEIVEAANGKEAVERVQEARRGEARPFDGILMDSSMPFMDGPTATRLIREQLGYRGLIFGVTGNAFQSDIDTFIESGVNEVITKPLGEEKYAYIIRAVVQSLS